MVGSKDCIFQILEGNLAQSTFFFYNRRFSPELLTEKCHSYEYGKICMGVQIIQLFFYRQDV